jgi:hypothetical protein
MRRVRVESRSNRAVSESLQNSRDLRYFHGGHEDFDANSADEVISEIGLVLVVMLGAVLAINMALVALHIG